MKKALNTFWNEFTTSAGNPGQLSTYARKPLASGLRYMFWLLYCTSLVTGIWIAVGLAILIPHIRPFVDSTAAEVQQLYPDGLVVTIEKGKLSMNRRNPVVIDFPERWREAMDEDMEEGDLKGVEHLITIDTSADADDYADYKSVVLVTESGFAVPDRNGLGGVRVIPFDNEKSTEITQKDFNDFMTKILPFLQALPKLAVVGVVLLMFILPFVFAGAQWLWYLVYLLIITLLAWLLAKIMGKKHTYKELYRLGCYAITLPVLYGVVAWVVPFLHAPFVFSLIFLIWMGVVFGSEKVKKRKTA